MFQSKNLVKKSTKQVLNVFYNFNGPVKWFSAFKTDDISFESKDGSKITQLWQVWRKLEITDA